MACNAVFIDTWEWAALGYRRDKHHETVKDIYKGFRDRRLAIYTSDYVLDELITLGSRKI
ncbi:MAG: hypothetical protein KJ638_04515 [Chloroflexi bacterium]|nr:hypothetical protein [Chloroflexota bacterium]